MHDVDDNPLILYSVVRGEIARQGARVVLGTEDFIRLCTVIQSIKDVPGAFAEVGVYAGMSARAMCEYKGDRDLHLFDTFCGVPYHQAGDAAESGDFSWPLDKITLYLSGYPGVITHAGIFPFSAVTVYETTFAFVHLDADTYKSTWDGLGFFWHRMSPGGKILVHDAHCRGPRQAIREFLDIGGTFQRMGNHGLLCKGL